MLSFQANTSFPVKAVFTWPRLFLAVFMVLFVSINLAYAQELKTDLPALSFDEKAVNEIEKLAITDLEKAKTRAQHQKDIIEKSTRPHQAFIDKKHDQARQYRDLEKSNEENAKINWERAKKWTKEAKDPLLADNKAFVKLMEESTKDSERDAKADEQRAKEYRSKATSLEREAQEIYEELAEARELIKRLDAIIDKEKEQPKPDPERSKISEQKSGSEPANDVPKVEFENADIIGLWRYTHDDGGHFAIVHKYPDPEVTADDAYLQVHTDGRVWDGAMYARDNLDMPLAEFTYKPKADEMNNEIPWWARAELEGELEWKLELHEAGDLFDPKLRVKFFPGEVRWPEGEDKETGVVKVIGEGLPRVFEVEPLTMVNVHDLAQERISLSLGGNHDPDANPVQALMKRQKFQIKISLPAELAKKQGKSLEVTIKGLTNGKSDTLKLTGTKPVGQRPVIYSHTKMVYIADCDVFGDKKRNPQTMSIPWIFSVEGDCMDVKTDNEEVVEFSFGEVFHRVTMYDSWVQRGIARHKQGFERVGALLEQKLEENHPESVKKAVRIRQQMIENYKALASSGKLTDVHIFHIGEEYLGDLMGTGLIYQKDASLEGFYKSEYDPHKMPTEKRTDPNFYNKQVQAFLEGVSGKDLELDAHKKADVDIKWTSKYEQHFITKSIRETSGAYASRVVKSYAKSYTLGLYDGIANATKADQFYLIMSGRDHMKNKKQPFWMRLNAAIGLTSSAILRINSLARTQKFMRSGSYFKTLGRGSPSKGLILSGKTRGQSATVTGSLDDAVSPPKTLSKAQKGQLALQLEKQPKGNGGPNCRVGREKPVTPEQIHRNFSNMTAKELREYRALKHGYVEKNYPKGTKFVDPYSKKILDTQEGPSCNLMSTNYAIFKYAQKFIPQSKGMQRLYNLMWAQVKAGKRNLDDLFRAGTKQGYDQGIIRRYLRAHGARVAEVSPLINNWVKLRHIGSLLKSGWHVKVILKFGKNSYHAVIVDSIKYNPVTKKINSVRIYDSNLGRLIDVPAKGFKDMLAVNVSYGNLTAFRFD